MKRDLTAWVLIPAMLLAALTPLASVLGGPSRLIGAFWMFCPMAAFLKTTRSGWLIAAVFATGLVLQFPANRYFPPEGVDEPDLFAVVWTGMLGAALLMGLLLGRSQRRSQAGQ